MALGDFLVAYLRRAGVTHLFGLPGDLVLGLFYRFGRARDLEIVTFSHETRAGMAASLVTLCWPSGQGCTGSEAAGERRGRLQFADVGMALRGCLRAKVGLSAAVHCPGHWHPLVPLDAEGRMVAVEAAGLLAAGLAAGWYVSFSGIVTFKKFDGVEAVRRVPADRLLIETDSPYLSPVPHRGRRNEPSHLVRTCRAVAELREEAFEVVAENTRANALKFYNLPG